MIAIPHRGCVEHALERMFETEAPARGRRLRHSGSPAGQFRVDVISLTEKSIFYFRSIRGFHCFKFQ
jgi:hypothetical protein